MTAAAPFGVYVHVPFCARRCDYCAFATWTDRSHLVERYLAACRLHLERAVAAGLSSATSVFVGGGTPSLVPGELLGAVLDAIPVADRAEVTVECNPDTVTPGLLASYRRHGVTRLSFGVQSMVPHVLASLGRTHEPAKVVAAVEAARAAGFATFNLDLIYGAAGEDLVDWQRTLEAALALDPPHVSAYGLTVEAGTPLAADPARHPDDDDQADKYLVADELLGAAGLGGYEISNWARPGHECRHNLLYWAQGEYLGVGCAAHSHLAGRRSWSVRTPERYVALVEAGEPVEAGAERLDAAGMRLEGLQLALRTRDGVPAEALPPGPWDEGPHPLVVRRRGRAVLTREGRLVANELAVRLE
ncbi:MAG: radical SAM family heme chaperone HemW [Acidimicrobiales bacterium]|nr:radical SAM family heme chaperone HemW [Acidimicrobiales bacterium]